MQNQIQIFVAPGKYIQGPDSIKEIGKHIAPLGDRVMVIGGKSGLAVTRKGREEGFKQIDILQIEEVFQGECSDAEITRLTELTRVTNCNVLMASGGGKAIDAVKAAAENLSIPAVIIPTIASNDSPCSALSVIYHEDGTFKRHWLLKKNPSLVLVDTAIIAKSPVRHLVSGMGDALATWFEADACYQSNALNIAGGKISLTAITLARLCFDILMEYGIDAKIACEKQEVTPALEKIVEANTLLSGLGFESGGVAIAHALSEGFSIIEEMHHFSHGEKVAFGLLVHLIIEDRPIAVINEVFEFCYKIGLPITLGELNSNNINRNILRQAADIAAEPGRPSGNLSFPVTGEMIFQAILDVDDMGKRIKNS